MTLRELSVGSTTSVQVGARIYDATTESLLASPDTTVSERFPMLGRRPGRPLLGGWIGLTLDFLPMLGVEGKYGNVFYGLGFCGHGVAHATLMGAMLAERVQGREHEWKVALRRRMFSWPPEPFSSARSSSTGRSRRPTAAPIGRSGRRSSGPRPPPATRSPRTSPPGSRSRGG